MADETDDIQSENDPAQDVDDGGLTDEDVELFEDDPTIPTE